jgi:hypothetical protein
VQQHEKVAYKANVETPTNTAINHFPTTHFVDALLGTLTCLIANLEKLFALWACLLALVYQYALVCVVALIQFRSAVNV